MNRLSLLVALLTLILLAGLPQSAPAGAQETITATGGMDNATLAGTGGMVQSSRIELSFPTEGGQVTGTWTVVARMEVPNFFNDESCLATVVLKGPLSGTYDGAANLGGDTTATNSGSECGATEITEVFGTEVYGWSAVFEDNLVTVSIAVPDGPWGFAATVAPAPDTDTAAPPDDSLDIAGIFFDTAGLGVLDARIEELAGCIEPINDDRSRRTCRGGRDADADSSAFFTAFDRSESGLSPHAEAMAWVLAEVITLTRLQGPDDQPLFPSLLAAGPVIERLADLTDLEATQQEQGVNIVGRFVGLLAAQDAASWEKRYP